jgi:hypothetical protein
MAGYTKEFLVEVALSRFEVLPLENINYLRDMFNDFYDKVGKDKFRTYSCVTADLIKEYKAKW